MSPESLKRCTQQDNFSMLVKKHSTPSPNNMPLFHTLSVSSFAKFF